ncbi:metallophosphatase [Deltaproteobacteria bacterium]|nr:metallophosphatase [Deltaproteobacteria bacterium]
MVVFATVALAVFALVHATIWWRLVGAPGLEGAPQALATAALAVCFVSVPAALASRVFGTTLPPLVPAIGFRWVGLMFYWFILSVAAEPVVRALSLFAPGGAWPQAAAAGVAVVGVALSIYALAGARTPPVKRVDVPIHGLDPALEGFRIAQLSDVHLGNTIGRDFIEAIVERTNAESVDLVALTGDFVDGTVAALGPAAAPFADLRSRHGSYFVTGNHEYFSGAGAWCTEFSRLGITVLRNDHRTLVHDGAGLVVAGVDDPFANEPGHGPDLARALAGRGPGLPVVLLAHQPIFAEQAAHAGVSLMLSGHTHGGQLWPFSLLVSAVQPILAGLVRVADTWVYVSRGTGWWGPPMRLGAPNEITVLTLRRA